MRVVVNGSGRLLDLAIPQSAVHGSRAEGLTQEITQIVQAAKRKADVAARQRLYEIIGHDLPIGSQLKPDDPPAPAAGSPGALPEYDDEDFSQRSCGSALVS